LKYVPETKIKKADKLGKRPDWKVGVEKDNENQKLIKEEWIFSLAEVVVEEPEVNILEKIKIARGKCEKVIKIVEVMKKAGVKVLRSNELSGAVHTGVEVHRMDLEMSRLVERPWLQLMCCTICLPRSCNFR